MSADRVRWEHIQRVFEQCDRNVSETARRLNMHRRTLQRILGKHAPRSTDSSDRATRSGARALHGGASMTRAGCGGPHERVVLITLQLVLNALALGMAYALVALGFVLALNASGAVNFAHGDLVVLGGAVAVLLAAWLGLPGFLLLPLVALASACAGVLAAHVAILPLARRPPEATFVATIALAAIIEQTPDRHDGRGAAHRAAARRQRRVRRRRRRRSAGSRWRSSWSAACWSAAVWFLLERTQIGRRMRAVASDRHMARAVGIPVGRYVTLSLALSGALAGIAGFLLGHQFLVTPTQGAGHMLKAYIAVALGGWGSVPGALIGALAIGVFETFVSAEVGDAWASAALYIAVLLVLAFRPRGLFGEPVDGAPDGRSGALLVMIPIVGIVACRRSAERLVTLVGIYALLGLGYQLVFGQLRALNLAQGALFGVGAYAAALTAPHVGPSRLLIAPLAAARCGSARGPADAAPAVALFRARHPGARLADQSRRGERRGPHRRRQRPGRLRRRRCRAARSCWSWSGSA